MKPLYGIYVVLTTVLTMEASAHPYVSYSGQPQSYFGQNQWSARQSDYQNPVQPGYFQQQTQDWGSRSYQPSGYEPNRYNSAPAPPNYQPSLRYPVIQPQPSTANAYGSPIAAMGDPYPQQVSPQQTQPQGIENNDDPSKFKIFHLPLPHSAHGKTIQLPITGDPSKFRVVHMNQGAATEVEPSRSTAGISSDALNALSRVHSDLEQIKLNAGAYRETDYLTNQQNPQQSTSYSNVQPASSGTSGYGNQGVTYNSGQTYPQSYGNVGGVYPQRGVSKSDAQADASSNSGNLGAGYNSGDSYLPNVQNYRNQGGALPSPGMDNSGSQAISTTSSGSRTFPVSDGQANAASNSGNLAAGYNSGDSYLPNVQNYRNPGGALPIPGMDYSGSQAISSTSSGSRIPPVSDGQANAASHSGNLGAGYNNGDSYLPNVQNYRNPGGAVPPPLTDYDSSQGITSTSSDSRSPPVLAGDESYPTIKKIYGNQGGTYTNENPYQNNNNNQPDSAKPDVYPRNDNFYPANNNQQDFGNQNVSPVATTNYPVNSNDWQSPDNYSGLRDNRKPNRGNSNNLQGSGMDEKLPVTGEPYVPNNSNGQAPVTQNQSPQNGNTYFPPGHHRHIPGSKPSVPATPSSTTAQASASSQGGTTKPEPTAPGYGHPHHHHNSPHNRPHHSPSTNYSPGDSQTTDTTSSSSVPSPASNQAASNLHIHGGPPIFHTPGTHKIPIRGGPNKFRHPSTLSPHSNRPIYNWPINGDSPNVQPGYSDNTQPQPNDSDNAPAQDQYGTPNRPIAPQSSQTGDGFSDSANNPQNFGDSSVPANDVSQSGLPPTDNIYAPTDDTSNAGDYKDTQPEPSDSQVSAFTNSYNDGTDSITTQLIPTKPYKLPNPTASQDDGNSSPDGKSDGVKSSNTNENIGNSQVSPGNPSLSSSDSYSPSKNSTVTLPDKTTTEVSKNTEDAPSEADDEDGSPDGLKSYSPTDKSKKGGRPASKPTRKSNRKASTASALNRFFDNKKQKHSSTSSPTSGQPTDKPKRNYNANADYDSLDLGTLLGLEKGTKTDEDILKSLQNLGIDDDGGDAGNSANGTFSGALGQGQAAKLGTSKTNNSFCSDGSAWYQPVSKDSSYYSQPLRVLIKIIATLEKLFAAHE